MASPHPPAPGAQVLPGSTGCVWGSLGKAAGKTGLARWHARMCRRCLNFARRLPGRTPGIKILGFMQVAFAECNTRAQKAALGTAVVAACVEFAMPTARRPRVGLSRILRCVWRSCRCVSRSPGCAMSRWPTSVVSSALAAAPPPAPFCSAACGARLASCCLVSSRSS